MVRPREEDLEDDRSPVRQALPEGLRKFSYTQYVLLGQPEDDIPEACKRAVLREVERHGMTVLDAVVGRWHPEPLGKCYRAVAWAVPRD